jgi:hypothetical protein
MNKSVTLPSGAELRITVSPFPISKALYQAVMEEMKAVRLDPSAEIDANLFKDLLCIATSSKKIEGCLEKCFERSLYNGRKIDTETFEPVEARDDYLAVCWEVAKENILPFTKSLYAQYAPLLEKLRSVIHA